jgi:AraC-like DNA-binding protein
MPATPVPNPVPAVPRDGTFRRWQSPWLPGLELVSRGLHEHWYPPHLHDALEITWVLEGTGAVEYRHVHHTLNVSDAFIIAPNESHAGGSCGGPFAYATIHVSASLLDRTGHDAGGVPLDAVCGIRRGAAIVLEPALVRLLEAADAGEQLHFLSALMATFLDADLCDAADCHPAVRRVRAMLHTSNSETPRLRELAGAVNLHERYLISLFKQATGMPPHRYSLALRLEMARTLLAAAVPPGAAAADTGFTDQAHLTRHFKRVFGTTPAEYQRTVAAA